MAYCDRNFKTKKAMKEAVARGDQVTVFQPANDVTGFPHPKNGKAHIEGPHSPAIHTWGANVILKDGIIIKVK